MFINKKQGGGQHEKERTIKKADTGSAFRGKTAQLEII